MSIKAKLAFWVIIFTSLSINAQESLELISQNYFFPDFEDYGELSLYGLALKDTERSEFRDEVIFKEADNAHALDVTRSVDLLLESISRSNSKREKADYYMLIADKYFERKDYKNAKFYFEKTDPLFLSLEARHEMQFKLGYTSLVSKDFQSADKYFVPVANSTSPYRDDAVYYEGICAFYLGDRERAVENFSALERSSSYGRFVPFYLAQIYFRNEDYDKAIKYGKSRIASQPGAEKYLIERILGLSYLAQGDYENAVIHLEAYANEADRITENDAFQLGVAHFRLEQFEQALDYFRELSYQDSEIGQMSNFLLASTSMNLGKKQDAQSAFKQASKLDYFPEIKDESEFLYLKLSAELGDERIAINGLSGIGASSPYYDESQELLSKLLFNSQDVSNAIATIEELDFKSTPISQTYKSLCYENGMLSMKDGAYADAAQNFEKALATETLQELNNSLYYHLAVSYDETGEKDQSSKYLDRYLNSGDKSFLFDAYYLKSYQHMDNRNYTAAIQSLVDAIENFNPEKDEKLLFDDAIVRLADLELVRNNYQSALEYYDLAIENNASDSDYILYQKALIHGVNEAYIEKLNSLELLLKEYPNSSYRDDGLFQLAETLVQLDKNNQAYQIYQTIINEFGVQSEYTSSSYMRQGLISYNQGDLDAALEAYKSGIKISTNKEEKRRALLAVEDIYLYDLNQADAFFNYSESLTGIKIDDISKDSIVFDIALNIYKDGAYEKAIDQFVDYLDKYKNAFYKGQAYYYLGESYLVLKDYNNALASYLQSIETNNHGYYESALKKAAVISFNHAKDFEQSLKLYKKLIEDEPGQPNLEYLEAALYSAFKTQNDEAILRYGEIVSTHSQASSDSKSTAAYHIAKVLYKREKYSEALRQFEAVVELSSNNMAAEASYLIARIHFRNQEYNKAEEKAFETAQVAANYPLWVSKSIMLIADIYSIKKDYLNATAAYESIIENFTDNTEVLEEAKTKLAQLKKQIDQESRITKDESFELIDQDTTQQK